MWKSINVNQQTRFIKYEQEQDWHKVYYSDVVNVWMEKLTSLSLSKRCKEMNSLVEAEPEDLAKHVRTLIVEGEEDIRITGDGESRTLHIESKLAGIPFYFMFRMEKQDADVVCTELTVPLMLLAVQQQAHVTQLQAMLIAKDGEIEQYKLEGAILKKKKVETEPYLTSCLAGDLEILHSDDALEPVHLLSKLSSLLSAVPTVKGNPSKRKMEVIHTKFEEKLEAEPVVLPTSEITTVKVEEPSADVPSAVKQNIGKSKKTKLRI